MHIGDWAGRGREIYGRKVAVTDDATGRDFTYADLDARAERLAAWLTARGIAKGDRVGALASNRVELFDLLFACGKLGASFVPYNWRLRSSELGSLLALTTPKVLFVSDEFLGAPTAGLGIPLQSFGVEYDAIVSSPGATLPRTPVDVDAEDTWVLLFTGGTTGLPKGVRISHRMASWNVLTTTIHHVRHDDVTLVHTPMFHTGGLFVHAVPVLALGGRVIVLRRWDTAKVMRRIEEDRVSVLFAVPTQLLDIMQSPTFAEAKLGSLRLLVSGGAALPTHVPLAYEAVHGIPVAQGFGMTEFGPNALILGPEDVKKRPGSIGRPNAFVEACVMGQGGAPAMSNEVGELCLRGGGLCSGYFGSSESPLARDGWFHTGDLARVDDEGYFTIAGRLKDMFVSGGENVYPIEVEEALYAHAEVERCAVVGVPDARWGEVGRAFVVLKPGSAATEEKLVSFLKAKIAGYKVPKRVDFVRELPATAAGKIDKRQLAALAAERGAA